MGQARIERRSAQLQLYLHHIDFVSLSNSISNLKSSLNSFVPRKKFSFKNKSHFKNPTNPIARKNVVSEFEKNEIFCEFGKNPTNSIAQKNVVSEVGNNENNEAVNEFRKSYDSPGFKDRENEVLVKDFRNSEVGEFVLVNLEGCEVRLIGCFRALFVHKLKNCRVYVGPVHGSVLIEEVEDCVFVLASHQIRIHHAKRCDFYLRVRSRPIIEDSNAVRFAPYCLRYDEIDEDLEKANLGEESGNWGNVDDFKWLRAVQSPNWSVLREDDRIGTICISSSDGAADC
ncbi:hypothetical protein Leryth_001566 [Lithospermum erythrorhizon]|nr:hypothetical protein Leryth_001566 [Lithospermum erythrorhizon]